MTPEWGPTVVSIATGIFIAGAWWSTSRDHGRRIQNLEDKTEDLSTRMTASEAWFKGYDAGKSK
jgi:hypothetical protein